MPNSQWTIKFKSGFHLLRDWISSCKITFHLIFKSLTFKLNTTSHRKKLQTNSLQHQANNILSNRIYKLMVANLVHPPTWGQAGILHNATLVVEKLKNQLLLWLGWWPHKLHKTILLDLEDWTLSIKIKKRRRTRVAYRFQLILIPCRKSYPRWKTLFMKI